MVIHLVTHALPHVHKGSFGNLYQGIILLLPSLLPDPSSSHNPALATPRSILVLETSTPCPPAPFAIFPTAAVPIHPRCCPRPLTLPSTTDGLSSPKTLMAPGHTPRKVLHQEGFEPNYENAIRQKKLDTIQSKFAGQIGGSASTRSKAAIDKASQVSEGKGWSGRRCKRVVAPDRQRTRELANSNDTTQKGALGDKSQAQDQGTRTQEGGTQEDHRQVHEEGTRPIFLAEEVTSTQEEGTPEDESQVKDEGTRPILLAEKVTSTQEEGTPEDESQAQDEGTHPILLAEEVTSTQEEGTLEDESQAQDEGTRPILLAEEVISTQEGGTHEDQRQVQEEEA
ncbi:hypothetical protein EJB05_01852, partial [Eragrostis curvula]